jgi:hypothetical protein
MVLSDVALLAHPIAGAKLTVSSDVSDIGVGCVLEQYVHVQWQPLAFYSRQFQPPEMRYSTFDRELLALQATVKNFQFMLEGRNVIAFTDHKMLVDAMHKVTQPSSA